MMTTCVPYEHQDRQVLFLAVASISLLALSLAPIGWSVLAWVSLVPLGFVLALPRLSRSSWAALYLAGLAFHLATLDWIRTLYGGTGLQGDYMPAWLISGQLGAVLFCTMVWLGRALVHRARFPIAVALPLAWLGYEVLQSQLATLSGGSAGCLVSLAYTQADNVSVAQIAAVGGAISISFLVAAVNGSLYEVLRASWNRLHRAASTDYAWQTAMVAPIVLLATVIYGHARLTAQQSGSGPVVSLMSASPMLIGRSGNQPLESDLLIWPELALGKSVVLEKHAEALATECSTTVVVGGYRPKKDTTDAPPYNSLVCASPASGLTGVYDKQNLVPFVEYVPTIGGLFACKSRLQFAAGQSSERFPLETTDSRTLHFGCGLCYDVASSAHFCSQLDGGNVDFFVLAGSEQADSTGVMSQLLVCMAQLRAIETSRPIVRNTVRGYSGVIDSCGRLVQVSSRQGWVDTWQLDALPQDNRQSLYARWGNWLPKVCVIVVLFALAWAPVKLRMRAWYWNKGNRMSWKYSLNRLGGRRRMPTGLSMIELLLVVAILGTLAALIIPRISASSDKAKQTADEYNIALLNAAVERWYMDKGDWPALDLSDIGADPEYLPEGIPDSPWTGNSYRLKASDHRVTSEGGK